MPATFDSLGIQFLYPENWQAGDVDEESGEGVVLELPSGGFFSIQKNLEAISDHAVLDQVTAAIESDYPDAEVEDVTLEVAPDLASREFRFFYLDLLIISRALVLHAGDDQLLIQIQAESQAFEENEMVFAAILKQITSG